MGVFSQIDLERQYEGDPFAEDNDFSAPPEQAADPSQALEEVLPAGESGALQEPEAPAQADGGTNPPAEGGQAEGKTNDEDEDVKRRAHEEAEAKRKAEWEARQQQQKAALQEQLDRLAVMSDDEVITASMKRVGADTEKLTRRNMKDCVAEHIQTLCLEDPAFARKAMDPRKSMVNCFRYISRKAWEYVQDELKANNITPGPGQQGYGCDIPDDLCYQWSVDYFNDPDAKEDQVEEEKFVPKPYYGKSSKTRTKNKTPAPKKAEPQKTASKPAKDSSQITLGAFSMPEEKAG